MEEFPGQRSGSRRYIFNGEIYYRDTRYRLQEKYNCSLRNSTLWRCRAVAYVDYYGTVFVHGEHNHPPRDIHRDLQRRRFIMELKRRALQSFATPLEIFHQIAHEFRDVAFFMRREAGCMHIIRERRRNRPPIPSSMIGLAAMLREYIPALPIYQSTAEGSDGSIGIIFSSPSLMNAVNEATELHIDGTFKCIPYQPRASQLLVIHIRKMDTGIGTTYVLCERRTTSMYNAIWTCLRGLAPRLSDNLQVVITDYEKALISSLRQSFPNIGIRGCWFHFTRAVTRKWRKLRLNNSNSDLLKLTWNLPLLPAEKFEEAMEILRIEARRIENSFENVQIFIRYIERYWLPIKNLVSVRASSIRTNNLAESCNRQLVNKLGGPFPNLYVFIEKLKIVIEQQEDILTMINNRQDLGRYRKNQQAVVDTYIYNMQIAFDNGRITLLEFLKCISTRDIQNRIDESNMRLNDESLENDDAFPNFEELQDPPDIEPVREPIILQLRRRSPRQGASGARRPYNRSAERRRSTNSITPPRTGGLAPHERMLISPILSHYDSDSGDSDLLSNTEPVNVIDVPVPDDLNIYGQLEFLNFPEDREPVEDENVCCNCLVNRVKVILSPCNHACLCLRCKAGKDLIDNWKRQRINTFRPLCPICRKIIKKTFTILYPSNGS